MYKNGITIRELSLPSWERGLKFLVGRKNGKSLFVAPLVGAWIEILKNENKI